MQEAPSNPVEFNIKGQRLLNEGNLDEALAALSEAIMLDPAYVNAYLNRADVLEKLGRVGEAQADRQTARALTAAGPAAPAPAGLASAVGTPWPVKEKNVAGPGRYILNFLLLGFIGLGLTYFLRERGWLATWISLGILVVILIVVVSAGG